MQRSNTINPLLAAPYGDIPESQRAPTPQLPRGVSCWRCGGKGFWLEYIEGWDLDATVKVRQVMCPNPIHRMVNLGIKPEGL